jgi:hypothetical protein
MANYYFKYCGLSGAGISFVCQQTKKNGSIKEDDLSGKKESRQSLGSFPQFIYVYLSVQFKTISSTNI